MKRISPSQPGRPVRYTKTMTGFFRLALVPISLVLLTAFTPNLLAEEPRQKPRSDRLLSIAVNEGSDNDYARAMAAAKRTGLDMVSLPIPWDSVEVGRGRYALDPNYLAIANAYFPTVGLKVALEVNPIDTNHPRLPLHLRGHAFDNPAVVEGYQRLLDYVFGQIPDLDLVSLTIGNEVDGLLHDKGAREAYIRFLRQVIPHAKSKRPGLIVGVKAMFHGLTGRHKAWLQRLNGVTDVVMATYYPLREDFTVAPPETVSDDLAKLVEAFPGRTLHLAEIGCPSGPRVMSSEATQAAFVRQAFQAWDTHSDQIKLMNFTWLHDQPDSSIQHFEEYYGSSDPRFIEFLATLGLRTRGGKDKAAFRELVRQAKARGW